VAKAKASMSDVAPKLAAAPPSNRAWIQRLSVSILWKNGDAAGIQIRDLLQQSRLKPGAVANRDKAKTLLARLDSLLWVAGIVPPSVENEKSQNMVSLALNLLSQSIIEVQSYLSGGTADSLADATISLGEAMKALSAMKGLLDRTSA